MRGAKGVDTMQFSSRLPIAVHILLCIHSFDGKEKLFEAHLFMSYEDIRDEVRRVLDYSLSTPEAAAEP